MPLFMDRHDIPGITAEEVAQAHLTDLRNAAKYAVQFLTYWFDPDHGRGVLSRRSGASRGPDRRSTGKRTASSPTRSSASRKTTSCGSSASQ